MAAGGPRGIIAANVRLPSRVRGLEHPSGQGASLVRWTCIPQVHDRAGFAERLPCGSLPRLTGSQRTVSALTGYSRLPLARRPRLSRFGQEFVNYGSRSRPHHAVLAAQPRVWAVMGSVVRFEPEGTPAHAIHAAAGTRAGSPIRIFEGSDGHLLVGAEQGLFALDPAAGSGRVHADHFLRVGTTIGRTAVNARSSDATGASGSARTTVCTAGAGRRTDRLRTRGAAVDGRSERCRRPHGISGPPAGTPSTVSSRTRWWVETGTPPPVFRRLDPSIRAARDGTSTASENGSSGSTPRGHRPGRVHLHGERVERRALACRRGGRGR
jgi:hypothetical protein